MPTLLIMVVGELLGALGPLALGRRRPMPPRPAVGLGLCVVGLMAAVPSAIRLAFLNGGWGWLVGMSIGVVLFVGGVRMVVATLG